MAFADIYTCTATRAALRNEEGKGDEPSAAAEQWMGRDRQVGLCIELKICLNSAVTK